jgi:hypothetical protein
MITAGLSRTLAGLAAVFALLTAKPALALQIDYVDIQPSTIVKIGDVITITATLINDTSRLGSYDAILCAEPEPTCDQPSACGHWGQYSMFPDISGVVAYPTPTETMGAFNASYGVKVSTQWKFTATRTGTVSFGVVASQPGYSIAEGCSDPTGCGYAGYAYWTYDPSTCGLGPITVESDLKASSEIHCISPGGRPAGSAFPGDDFVVVLSLKNEGKADVTVDYAVCTKVVGDLAAFTPTGTPSFPQTITQNNSAYFTWAYHVNAGAPAPASLSFRTDANRILADTNTLNIVVPPVDMTVTMYVDPDGAGPATPDFYGDGYYMAQDEIMVVATLVNTSVDYDLDVDPVIVSSDWDLDGKPDYRPIGIRDPAPGVVSLNKITSRKFTWKYEVERGSMLYGWCRDTETDPGWFHRYLVSARGIQANVLQNVRKEIASIAIESPRVVQMGKPFSVTVWVTSLADRPVVLDPSATPYLTAGAGTVIAVTGGPSWTGTRYFDSGERLPYVFDCSPVSVDNQSLNAGITYDMFFLSGTSCLTAAAPVNVAVIAPSPFTAVMVPNTTDVNSGRWYQLNLTVTNNSGCDSTLTNPAPAQLAIAPYLAYSSEITGPFSKDFLWPPNTIPDGQSRTFCWSVTTWGCGDADWTGTGTGDWAGACTPAAFIMPFTSSSVRIRQESGLNPSSLTVALSRSQTLITRNYDVVLTVVPSGQNDIKDFDVKLALHRESGAVVTPIAIPSIPAVLPGCGRCVTDICPDKSRSFTWTFRADDKGTGLGNVWYTFSVTGTDKYSSEPVAGQPWVVNSAKMKILKPSTLSAAATVTRCNPCSPVVDGCGLDVEFDVFVDGDTPIAGTYTLSAEPVPVSGGGAALAVAPVLDGKALMPGKAEFQWLYTPEATGGIKFTMSIVGTEADLGGMVYATATTPLYVVTPPALVASGSVYRGAATGNISITTAPGQSFKVIMKVENQGDVAVDGVALTTTATGSAACAGSMPVALPVTGTYYAEVNLTAGSLRGSKTGVFIWDLVPGPDPDGVGIMAFSMTLAGYPHDDTKNPMSISAQSMCVTILPPPVEARAISTAPASVDRGTYFDVVIELANLRGLPVVVTPTTQMLSFPQPGFAGLAPPPPAPVTLAAGATTRVSARARAAETAALGTAYVGLAVAPFTAVDNAPSAKGVSVPVNVTGAPVAFTVTAPIRARLMPMSRSDVVRGAEFDVTVELANGNAAMTASPVFPILSFSNVGISNLNPPPPGIETLAAGESKRVTTRAHVLGSAALGPTVVSLTATPFTAVYTGGTAVVPVTPDPGTLTVNVIPAETIVTFGENPYHVLRGRLPVHYVLPEGGKATIKVYSITGELVRTILESERPVEERIEYWDGKNEAGQTVAAGLYLVRFESRKLKTTRKLAVIK